MAHYDETKNRFNPENRFVGDIENGKRYPFGCYTEEESDAKYAVKAVEGQVAALAEAVANKADESEAVEIRARLDALEHKSIFINSFAAIPLVSEIGSTQIITLVWDLSKPATTQTINGSPVTGNTKQYTGVTTNTRYTLAVSDGQSLDSRTVTAVFANRIYYGTDASASITSELIASLSDVLSDEKARTITVSPDDEYIYYAYPKRLGPAVFTVGMISGGFEDPVTISYTNNNGYTEDYYVYRSTQLLTGTIELKIS